MAPEIDRILADTTAGIEQAVEDSRRIVAGAVRGSAAAIADARLRCVKAVAYARAESDRLNAEEDRLYADYPADRDETEDFEGGTI